MAERKTCRDSSSPRAPDSYFRVGTRALPALSPIMKILADQTERIVKNLNRGDKLRRNSGFDLRDPTLNARPSGFTRRRGAIFRRKYLVPLSYFCSTGTAMNIHTCALLRPYQPGKPLLAWCIFQIRTNLNAECGFRSGRSCHKSWIIELLLQFIRTGLRLVKPSSNLVTRFYVSPA